MTLFVEAVGWAGAGCLLLAYALLSAGRLTTGPAYQLLNLAGSVGLAVNAIVHSAWPSSSLNLVWLAIGLAALARRRVDTSTAERNDIDGSRSPSRFTLR
ncbi:CBU_0592 family membrane protein [Phytohabitans rumicis]|uniref:CBU-0592-like domain-containing protein n=1 Tax=Phytohabitans rumicis TaxID=1076125 RepID=A0A6V8LNR5_9ACTN|nr:hypothetical protein [Phytohabitans rumicis]GFJ94335.1 hypothetical protein Prum_079770 [Phytohabitans rumicis]